MLKFVYSAQRNYGYIKAFQFLCKSIKMTLIDLNKL